MEFKDYQRRTLATLEDWREALDAARADADKAVAALEGAGLDVPDTVRDFARAAWGRLAEAGGVAATAGKYVARTDDAGRPIPHVCLKIPTGGGKTLLGAAAPERLGMRTGFVLWIVPSRAIYGQTKAALWSREHPYRQLLERASGGRVKMLEKDQPFTLADTEHYLCVMLLMLPAANRWRNREFLRMFRDSGRYSTLFPDADDARADAELLERHPDLERASADGPVKHSLFNALKMLRPVVVLDEAHKAYGGKGATEFVRAVNRLDPSLVIELSATPNRKISNLLVDVTGVELKQEEMIKLPVQVSSFSNIEWRDALARALAKLNELTAEAHSLQASEGRYIRPIAVVRVERTGRDQLDGEHVHAEDVRQHLVRNLGEPEDAVRVKSAELDEIAGEDLLSEYSQVRWIITKAALMEGWDCPFASLLVMLDNTRSQRALTQLVGRVMRPAARAPHGPRGAGSVPCLLLADGRRHGRAPGEARTGGRGPLGPRRRRVRRRCGRHGDADGATADGLPRSRHLPAEGAAPRRRRRLARPRLPARHPSGHPLGFDRRARAGRAAGGGRRRGCGDDRRRRWR